MYIYYLCMCNIFFLLRESVKLNNFSLKLLKLNSRMVENINSFSVSNLPRERITIRSLD